MLPLLSCTRDQDLLEQRAAELKVLGDASNLQSKSARCEGVKAGWGEASEAVWGHGCARSCWLPFAKVLGMFYTCMLGSKVGQIC